MSFSQPGWAPRAGEGLPLPPHVTQFPLFIDGMAARLALGWMKYGKRDNARVVWNHRATLKDVLAAYDEDGNMEHLIDAANYCLLEFGRPSHPKAHYKETDGDESVKPTRHPPAEAPAA